MPFRSSIVGGIGTLIRQFIKSPNYVPGVSGWSINKDGSVEFNNGTFRGTIIVSTTGVALLIYSGAPANGNLYLSIAAADGIDAFGNHYLKGLMIAAPNSGFLYGDIATGAIVTSQSSQGISATVDWEVFTNAGHSVTLLPDGPLILESIHDMVSLFMGATTLGLKVGAGSVGKYYSEKVVPAVPGGQVIASGGGLKTLTTFVVINSETDYGSAFNLGTGVWTCPVTSKYTFTFTFHYTAWVAVAAATTGEIRNLTAGRSIGSLEGSQARAASNGRFTISATDYFNVGDTVDFEVFQNTGAPQNVDNANTFILVQREL